MLACLVAALLVALRSRASVAAREAPQITVRRPVEPHRPQARLGRHRVGAAAVKRALGTALVVVGLLVLADAAATLAWQEAGRRPAARAQHRLEGQLRAIELAAPPQRASAGTWPRPRRSWRARAGGAQGGRGRAAHRAHRPARRCRGARDLAGRPARGAGPHRRHAAARRARDDGRPPGTARPPAPRFAISTRCAAATAITLALPYAHFRLPRPRGSAATGCRSLPISDSVDDRLRCSPCHPLFSAARRIVVLARAHRVGGNDQGTGTDA